jgi:hypothetical protein
MGSRSENTKYLTIFFRRSIRVEWIWNRHDKRFQYRVTGFSSNLFVEIELASNDKGNLGKDIIPYLGVSLPLLTSRRIGLGRV